MTAGEVRELWTAYKRCTVSEFRSRLLEALIAKNVGLKEIEDFVSKEARKMKGGGGVQYKKISKIQDAQSYCEENDAGKIKR